MLGSNLYDVLVVGAGVFGITTALEFQTRGYRVAVLDPGPLPHPLAASTDISKIVRMEYGTDEEYMELGERAYQGWLHWNETEELREALFHDVGVAVLVRQPMSPGHFEYESYHLLRKRGHSPERLTGDEISRRFPAWRPGVFVDGFFHAEGGYVESGRAIASLVHLAQVRGVTLYPDQAVAALLEDGPRVTGVRTRDGSTFLAGQVVLAAGAWTSLLLPELATVFQITGQPVFHLKPENSARFTPPDFPVFTADVTRTGWYGFPFHPREQVLKIGSHGAGQVIHPERDERVVTENNIQQLRAFLAETCPALEDAPIVFTRRCLYVDTPDGDFWIDRHPQKVGLTVATGDSGHGFKFAPILGGLIADAVEGKQNPWLPKFRWREFSGESGKKEASRQRE
jgi:glycine/D-amino acid oxidase-like deaminating enzyme